MTKNNRIDRPLVELWFMYIIIGVVFLGFCLFGRGLFSSCISNIVAESPQLVVEHQKHVPSSNLPIRLIIPSINVNTKIQTVGLSEKNTDEMGVPDNFIDVGWYENGPKPGEDGSAVITGHMNGKNLPEAVFYNLKSLKVNDLVEVIDEDYNTLIFKVVKVITYAHDSPTDEVFVSTDGKSRLNLITCGGDWLPSEKLYDERIVVFTELVNI